MTSLQELFHEFYRVLPAGSTRLGDWILNMPECSSHRVSVVSLSEGRELHDLCNALQHEAQPHHLCAQCFDLAL